MNPAPFVLLLGIGAAFAVPMLGRADTAPTHGTTAATTPAPTAAPAPITAAPAAPATIAAPAIAFPDGSQQPLLNGATATVTIDWPTSRPFAPVRGRIVHAGTEFYEHTDGTYTTSVVRKDLVSGKELTIGLIYTPEARSVQPQLTGDR
ncbi:MAG: hypothetical protein IPK26_28750 [Planctomycetes bacterium]|nr:hypothetical protein [Planctomycetota bacterium]